MDQALIDVLIPTYNAAATLKGAVASIQNQTIKDIKIIVIDDGSTDETPAILNCMAKEDQRLRVITTPNRGIVDALNLGLSQCTAEFIARHDSDDLADRDRFSQQLAYLQEHRECVAVSSFARHIEHSGEARGSVATFPPPDTADPLWVPSKEPYMAHPFLMVRRTALLEVGGYRYAYHAEDTDLYWRLQEIGRLHIIEKIMGDYRFHAQSISSKSVLNGRLSAINSQLAAISATRRRSGRCDLTFERSACEEMTAAASSAGMFALAKRTLMDAEVSYLKPAYAAKLLELAEYRPYELDQADCRFIEESLKMIDSTLTPANLKQIRSLRSTSTARLLRTGHIRSGIILFSTDTAFETIWRLGLQVFIHVLPPVIRRALRKLKYRRLEQSLGVV